MHPISTIEPRSHSTELLDAFLRENIHDAVVYTDKDLIISGWNRSAENLYGWTASEVIGRKITDMLIPVSLIPRIKTNGGCHVFEETRYTQTGETVMIQVTVNLVQDKDGSASGMLYVARDITDQKNGEEEKRSLARQLKQEIGKKNREIKDVFDRVSDGVLLLDKKWTCLYVNTKLSDMLRLGPVDMIGKQFLDIFPTISDTLAYNDYAEVMSGRPAKLQENYYEPANLWYETSINPFSEGLAVFVRDISEKKKAERNISRKSRMYHFSSQIGQVILRSPDRESLFKGVCDIAVTVGEFVMAWVGLVDEIAMDVIPAVYSGEGADYILGLNVSYDEKRTEGRGPEGMCIRQQRQVVCNHIAQDSAMERWKEPALKRGYQSCISLPLTVFDKVTGVITLYAGEKNYFDADEVSLLQETVRDLSFALENMESAGKQKDVEREIAQYKFALDRFAMIVIADRSGVIQQVNDNFCRVSGFSSEELVGKDFRMMNSARYKSSFMRQMLHSLQRGKIWKGDLCGKTSAGAAYWVDGTIVPFLNERGEPYQYLSIMYDITQRKKVETELKVFREVYEQVSKATSDFIRDWDLETNSIRFNVGLYQMFGYTEEEFNNSPDFGYTYMHPDDLPVFLETIRDVFEKKQRNFHAEYRFRCADGKYKYLFERAFLLYDDNEKPIRIVAAIQDITWQKNESMRLAKATLDAQENERTMLGRELHDNINQILVGSLINLQMSEQVNREKAVPLVQKSIGYIKNAINELRKLSHRLAPASFRDLTLQEIFENLVETFNTHKQLDIQLLIDDIPQTSMDEETQTHLYRICQEQLSNTFKYAKATEVTISIQMNADALQMRIADNGVGFDPRQSVKGIGLNNIRNRVSIMLGTLTLNTAPGKGCEMIVEIPMLKAS